MERGKIQLIRGSTSKLKNPYRGSYLDPELFIFSKYIDSVSRDTVTFKDEHLP
jgi:hypothetical protein